jgi:hypothetical protein
VLEVELAHVPAVAGIEAFVPRLRHQVLELGLALTSVDSTVRGNCRSHTILAPRFTAGIVAAVVAVELRQHQHARAQVDRFLEVVGDEEDSSSCPLSHSSSRNSLHLLARVSGSSAPKGLGPSSGSRLEHQRLRDRHALLHAAGQLVRDTLSACSRPGACAAGRCIASSRGTACAQRQRSRGPGQQLPARAAPFSST